jgi:hypothetical protein
MPKPTFLQVAELRILARIAQRQQMCGADFRAHMQAINAESAIELSAVARQAIRDLPADAPLRSVVEMFNDLADEHEARWTVAE